MCGPPHDGWRTKQGFTKEEVEHLETVFGEIFIAPESIDSEVAAAADSLRKVDELIPVEEVTRRYEYGVQSEDPCTCDCCESYGESQAGRGIHFVSKDAEEDYYKTLAEADDDYDYWPEDVDWTTVEVTTSPPHYSKYPIQPSEFIQKNNLSWYQGNIIKYVVRFEDKGGLDDLLKARSYLDQLIKEKRAADE